MDEIQRKNAIDALSHLGSVLREPNVGYGPVVEVDLGRGSTTVTDDVLVYLRFLPEVKNLYFDQTFVTDKIMDVLEFCPGLRSLNIENTQITDKGLEKLKHACSLESLTVGYGYSDFPEWKIPITDLGFQHVSLATNLKHLALSRTWVNAKGLTSIRNLDKIESLTLCPEQVSEESLLVLKGLPNLKTVWLTRGCPRENAIWELEPAVEVLRKELSNIEVNY